MNKLQLGKFDRRRFLKALQKTVPGFILEKPVKQLAKQLEKMQPVPQKKDEIVAVLEAVRLERYSGKLSSLGRVPQG